nr:MAG TPA: hypothetical protein [Caudoviricetes sp.]
MGYSACSTPVATMATARTRVSVTVTATGRTAAT